jgi:hypothetical protein
VLHDLLLLQISICYHFISKEHPLIFLVLFLKDIFAGYRILGWQLFWFILKCCYTIFFVLSFIYLSYFLFILVLRLQPQDLHTMCILIYSLYYAVYTQPLWLPILHFWQEIWYHPCLCSCVCLLFLAAFRIFSLSFILSNLFILYVDVVFSMFLVLCSTLMSLDLLV